MTFLVLSFPNLREDDAKFLELSKNSEGCPSRAGRSSRTFLGIPIPFRVSRGNPESRLCVPPRVGIFKG